MFHANDQESILPRLFDGEVSERRIFVGARRTHSECHAARDTSSCSPFIYYHGGELPARVVLQASLRGMNNVVFLI